MKGNAYFGENCEQNATLLGAATKEPRVKISFIRVSLLPKG